MSEEAWLAARDRAHEAEEELLRAGSWYEVHPGIRPPRKNGKVRGVAAERVPGGGMELWHCGHDHAPGVHRVPDLTGAQRDAAMACAEEHVRAEQQAGRMFAGWPVRRDP